RRDEKVERVLVRQEPDRHPGGDAGHRALLVLLALRFVAQIAAGVHDLADHRNGLVLRLRLLLLGCVGGHDPDQNQRTRERQHTDKTFHLSPPFPSRAGDRAEARLLAHWNGSRVPTPPRRRNLTILPAVRWSVPLLPG